MPQPKWAGHNPDDTQGPPGPPGTPGATTLLELTDVTGNPGTYGNTPTDDGTGAFPLTRTVTQDDLDAVLTSVADVVWHNIGDPGEPAFWNDFTNVGGGWAPARYRLTLNNIVHIEGVIACPTVLEQPIVMFQLPDNCLPGANLPFIVEAGGISRIVVQADGAVLWSQYVMGGEFAEQFISLSGINFSVGVNTPTVAAAAIAARFAT
jgi:hypothetical protein